MALQLTFIVHGMTVTNGYHKVSYVSGNKGQITVDMESYKDATEAATAGNHLDSFSFKMSDTDMSHDDGVTDKNYTTQAYEYLKAGVITDVSGASVDFTSATDL